MNWYIATLLFTLRNNENRDVVERCNYLIKAPNHDSAYEAALQFGRRLAAPAHRFEGLDDLLLIHESLRDCSELLWSEVELSEDELRGKAKSKQEMKAFQSTAPNDSGWYLGTAILREVHDEGSHGERLLVWFNSYLVEASNREAAYDKTEKLGREQEDAPGSHRCDGDKAHWEYVGINEIVPLHEYPREYSLLWCEVSDTTHKILPDKSELAVFKWEQQLGRRE